MTSLAKEIVLLSGRATAYGLQPVAEIQLVVNLHQSDKHSDDDHEGHVDVEVHGGGEAEEEVDGGCLLYTSRCV